MSERITAAACLYKGEVVTLPPPARHHTIIRHISETYPEDTDYPLVAPDDTGFVTDSGRYVVRKEAARIAVAAE